MNPVWIVATARLLMTPVGWADLPELRAIKADPLVFGMMLGGVRDARQTAQDLARDIWAWGARGFGLWSVRDRVSGAFQGITGLAERPDGRGVAVRFAFWPDAQGQGFAREAAGAALLYGHERAGLERIVGVARESNFASRMVLGGIGMIERDAFLQQGHRMILYESLHPDRRASFRS